MRSCSRSGFRGLHCSCRLVWTCHAQPCLTRSVTCPTATVSTSPHIGNHLQGVELSHPRDAPLCQGQRQPSNLTGELGQCSLLPQTFLTSMGACQISSTPVKCATSQAHAQRACQGSLHVTTLVLRMTTLELAAQCAQQCFPSCRTLLMTVHQAQLNPTLGCECVDDCMHAAKVAGMHAGLGVQANLAATCRPRPP